MNLNEVRLAGRLRDDPKLEFTAAGHPKSEFTIVLDRARYDPEQDASTVVTQYIGCVAWHMVAERIADSFRKGDMIRVEGEIDQQETEGPRGGKTTKTKVNVLVVTALRLVPRDRSR